MMTKSIWLKYYNVAGFFKTMVRPRHKAFDDWSAGIDEALASRRHRKLVGMRWKGIERREKRRCLEATEANYSGSDLEQYS